MKSLPPQCACNDLLKYCKTPSADDLPGNNPFPCFLFHHRLPTRHVEDYAAVAVFSLGFAAKDIFDLRRKMF